MSLYSINIKDVVLDISKCKISSENIAAVVKVCSRIRTLEISCTINTFVILKREALLQCTELCVKGCSGATGIRGLAEGLQHCTNGLLTA